MKWKTLLLVGTALASMSSPAAADPLSVGIAFLVNIGWTGAISGLGATIVGSAILGALGLGASLLSNALFQPKAQERTASDLQVTVRQSIGARRRFYGRVKVGGTLWFFDNATNGALYQAITLNEGEIDAIEENWLNDLRVYLDETGAVIAGPFYPHILIFYKMGTSTQTVHNALDIAFTDVGANHRLRGIANALCAFFEVPQDQIANVYPQMNPSLRVVMRASLVKSVRTAARIWSQNPADVVYDYLTAEDDAGFPYGSGFPESAIDLTTFQTFADLSDEDVDKKGGGTIKRYTANGGYGLNEEMRDVLPRMLSSCDGDLYLTTQGKIGIRGGQWVAPVLTLNDSHIISADFGRGARALAAFNELTLTYVEPGLDYQEAEGERWIDHDNVALLGKVRPAQLNLPFVDNHPQARRLAKIHTHKNNPNWQGRIITKFYGFNALGEQTLHLDYSPLGISEDFLIRRVTILPDMTGVEITLTSLSAAAYAWDADLEEGTGPASPPDTSHEIDLPPPEDFAVTVQEREVSGSVVGLYLVATWTEPDRTALSQQVEHRKLPSGDWLAMSVSPSVGLAESGIVDEGADYEVRIRTRSPGGGTGEWIDPTITIEATI